MILYNKKGNIVEFDGYEYLNEGAKARVFRKGNEVIKVYKSDTRQPFFLGTKMFEAIKKLNNPHVVKLLDYYYLYNGWYLKLAPVDAYTMEFVQDDNLTIIDESRDYILRMADMLDETVEVLTANKILIRDPNHDNIIFNKDRPILLDVDTYEFHKLAPHNKLKLYNQDAILAFFRTTMADEYKKDQDKYYVGVYDLYRLRPVENKTVKQLLEKVLTDDTPRKTFDKRLRLYK